jgi:hypothetical protein
MLASLREEIVMMFAGARAACGNRQERWLQL